MGLPLAVDGNLTCFACPAPCCTSYVVPMQGFDLWRMVRGLQLPWREVAEVRADRITWDAFAIEAQTERLGLFLRVREGEICRFLLTLPSGQQRCGAHASRPLACRCYPWKLSDNSQLGVEMIGHALCPAPQRAHFETRKLEARGPMLEELAERPVYRLLVTRWNEHVMAAQTSFSADDFVAWMLRVYDAMAPFREQEDWQREAARLISGLPLP